MQQAVSGCVHQRQNLSVHTALCTQTAPRWKMVLACMQIYLHEFGNWFTEVAKHEKHQ